jgi:DDE family transposase
MAPATASDPRCAQTWLRGSWRSLRARRAQVGHRVRAPTVGRLLNKHEYALHANAKKTEAGAQHPERDVQCRYRDSQKQVLMAGGKPIISVDTKNKALN